MKNKQTKKPQSTDFVSQRWFLLVKSAGILRPVCVHDINKYHKAVIQRPMFKMGKKG